ncbi:uncharacterized protein LOC131695080 [Topomyia yanbarensis]|uniref:uncharacterized protein LOC131695080 n=2 Tax=Topomyia yanbarensis TaxID=2498891 RepID=UPI00273B869A|nr:uncharacterized protein LOC131695080 [Topomyia yanbarensis]
MNATHVQQRLQKLLEQQGLSLSQSGYAFVSADSATSAIDTPQKMMSQDPLDSSISESSTGWNSSQKTNILSASASVTSTTSNPYHVAAICGSQMSPDIPSCVNTTQDQPKTLITDNTSNEHTTCRRSIDIDLMPHVIAGATATIHVPDCTQELLVLHTQPKFVEINTAPNSSSQAQHLLHLVSNDALSPSEFTTSVVRSNTQAFSNPVQQVLQPKLDDQLSKPEDLSIPKKTVPSRIEPFTVHTDTPNELSEPYEIDFIVDVPTFSPVQSLESQHSTSQMSSTIEGNENCGKCDVWENQALENKNTIKKLRRKIKLLKKELAQSNDHALSLSRELQDLKDRQQIPSVTFTIQSDFDITLEEIKNIDRNATTDSQFISNLAIHFFGVDRLKTMSVTGQPTPRFKNKLNADGSLLYPAKEQIDPKILKFIFEKLVERVAMRLGPHKIREIAHYANEKLVNKSIAQKISNLNKIETNRVPFGINRIGNGNRN